MSGRHWEPLGAFGPSGGVRGALGADWECRYSGASRSIGGIRGHWGLLGVVGSIGSIGDQ